MIVIADIFTNFIHRLLTTLLSYLFLCVIFLLLVFVQDFRDPSPCGLTHSNQFFHGDQTRFPVTFHEVHHTPRLLWDGATDSQGILWPNLPPDPEECWHNQFVVANFLVINYKEWTILIFIWISEGKQSLQLLGHPPRLYQGLFLPLGPTGHSSQVGHYRLTYCTFTRPTCCCFPSAWALN